MCTSKTQPDVWKYGIATIAINWLPGFAAAIHIVSMYRTQLPARKTLLYAGEIKLKAFVNIINSIKRYLTLPP